MVFSLKTVTDLKERLAAAEERGVLAYRYAQVLGIVLRERNEWVKHLEGKIGDQRIADLTAALEGAQTLAHEWYERGLIKQGHLDEICSLGPSVSGKGERRWTLAEIRRKGCAWSPSTVADKATVSRFCNDVLEAQEGE
jgi:hypothetical protein